MKKITTIIVPGFGGSQSSDTYKKIRKAVGENSYIFAPAWKYHSIIDWIREYENFIIENNIKDFTAIGFSVGAYIIACSKIIPRKTIYASMSPLFAEDLHGWTPTMVKPLGKWRLKSVGTYIEKPNTTFIVGARELPIVFDMIERIGKHNNVIKIGGVGHDISNEVYLNTVINLVKAH